MTDTMYGYYDKDSTQLMQHKWYGLMFFQFLQFMPSKFEFWFGRKIDENHSNMGHFIQTSRVDDKGNKHLKWRKAIMATDNPNSIDHYEITEENTGDPLIEWHGIPQEGLFQSILRTTRYLATGNMGALKSDELLRKRAMYGMIDAPVMMLLFGLLGEFIKSWIADNGTSGLSGETMSFANDVNKRVLSEGNVWANTFGAMQSTPAFYTYTKKMSGDMWDVLNGSKPATSVLRNIKAFEILDLDTNQQKLDDKEFQKERKANQ
jgi:hypothetical protein